jgi:AcrR family transcriptional regulator
VVQNQRDRIFDALAAVCAVKGYPATTVEDITARAGVSRRTFYDLFTDKEDCFIAAYDVIADRLLDVAGSAFSADEPDWPRQLAAGLRALIEVFGTEPALARLVIVEVLAAGRRALAHRDAALARFAAFFDGGNDLLPAAIRGRDEVAQAVIGGLYEALYRYVLAGEAERLPELMPDLVYCALLPYLGHVGALAVRGLQAGPPEAA